MSSPSTSPIRTAIGSSSAVIWVSIAFSLFINLMMLTGPLYMLQIYDRVLSSGSMETLLALTILILFIYGAMGILDFCRATLLGRIGARVENNLAAQVFDGLMTINQPRNDQPLRDLKQIRQFIASAAPIAIFDLPWSILFLAIAFMMHWLLGVIALLAAVILAALAHLNRSSSRRHMASAGQMSVKSFAYVGSLLRNAEVTEAMGMRSTLRGRWAKLERLAESELRQGADRSGGFSAGTRAFRFFAQSAILGAGALLAIHQIITPGMMIACSILMGRALAPIEQAVSQWPNFVSAFGAYQRLNQFLSKRPAKPDTMRLPPAQGALSVEQLSVSIPGQARPFLRGIHFSLERGKILGIIGPSAAGKSTLARALVGITQPATGSVRLDGAEIHRWNRDELGPQLGYLPQDVELFAGTVHENISRFREDATPELVVEAAKLANVHEMILRLPHGYDTEVGDGGAYLSGGQRQRIALARAVYGNPALIVLDEPNSNLDAEGEQALGSALATLKSRDQTVVIIAHRPVAIAHADMLLMLSDGQMRAFGPKSDVLANVLARPQEHSNVTSIERLG